MIGLGQLFSRKPDHPMHSPAAARDVLAGIDESKPLAALDDVAGWAVSVGGTDGFGCDNRFLVLSEIEACGNRIAAEVFGEYFRLIHVRGQAQRTIYQSLHDYRFAIAEGYGRCLADAEKGERETEAFKAHMALAAGRALRAIGLAERMRLLRYMGFDATTWEIGCRLYARAEAAGVAEPPLVLHPREVHTTIRAEFLRLLGLNLAALHELPPEQVELAGRILERFAISFSWSREREADCNFVVDLEAGSPPRQCRPDEVAGGGKRFFGGGKALGKLHEIEQLVEKDLLTDEARFGKEFTQSQIVSVIRHLLLYLGADPPQRRFARNAVVAPLPVVNGFAHVCQRVTALDAGSTAKIDDNLNVSRAHHKEGVRLAAEEIDSVPEVWTTRDRSDWGIGVEVSRGLGAWAEPGALCALQPEESGPWWVGIVRRVDAEEFGGLHCGIWILSKKPLSVHMRVIGTETNKASNWETSSGGFQYRYMRALLLPDTVKAHDRPVMLIERQVIGIGEICELLVGEHSRHLRLRELIEEGADYMRVGFEWMAGAG